MPDTPPQSLLRRVPWQTVATLLVVLGVLLVIPSVGTGLATDDHAHRAFLLAHLAGEADGQPWELFGRPASGRPEDLALMVYIGALPWWTSPNLSMALFRPLAVATHFLDYALWPDEPALMHVQNLIWYAGLLALLALLYRATLGASCCALLALLLYAADEAHVETVAWIAGRNTLMTAFFSIATLVSHDAAVRGGKRLHLAFSSLLLALAYLSSEGGVATLFYLGAYALFMDPRPVRRRLRSLLPAAGVTLAWRAVYTFLGYGMRGSAVYIDPSHPFEFLRVLPERLPAVLRDQFVLPPGWLGDQSPEVFARLTEAALVFGALLLLLSLTYLRRSRTMAFFLTGALLSALPVCAVGSAPRLLLITGVGGSAFVAEFVVTAARDLRGSLPPGPVAICRAALAFGLLVLHVPMALALSHRGATLPLRHEHAMADAAKSVPWGPPLWGRHLYVLNTANFFITAASPHYQEGKGPLSMHILSASIRAVKITRTAPDSFELMPQGGFLAEPWSTMVRSPTERFEVGYRLATGPLWVEVLSLTKDGRPKSLKVSGPALDGDDYVFIRWDPGTLRYQPLRLPALGKSLTLSAVVP